MSKEKRFESLVAECKEQVIKIGHVVPVIIVGFDNDYKVLPIIISKESPVRTWLRQISRTYPDATEMWIAHCGDIVWKENDYFRRSHAIIIFYGNLRTQQIWAIPYVKRKDVYYFRKPLSCEADILKGDLKRTYEELGRIFKPIGVV